MLYPAIDIPASDSDVVYALLDDLSPTAIEEREIGLRAFFASRAARDVALRAVSARYPAVAVDVSDEDWARRSQAGLAPITVGRITIHANPLTFTNPESPIPNPVWRIQLLIPPSMGFGTGHHATTRLCLAAMQEIGVQDRTVLDVGTGSGVLAIAARCLGAARAIGIDVDPEAIRAAEDNLVLNPAVDGVTFACADLTSDVFPAADLVTANLTGALLVCSASALLDAASAGGILVLSGLMTTERDDVLRAFAPAKAIWERRDDEWVGLGVKKP